MDIFKDLAHAVRFAFALERRLKDGGSSLGTLVRMALNETGINPWMAINDSTAEHLRTQADRILCAVHGNLLRVESAALTAAFSRNWDERRAAVSVLAPHFYYPLGRIVGNRNLVDKLVTRHYIAHRDRGAGWDTESLSQEFKTPKSRIVRAAQVVDHCARQIEAMALNTLREALGLPAPKKPELRANVQEVAHA